jgi:alkanesulfonate monooxygenase SsuD/methylene tetrahydromethanopterin reductase-like flavin-dependent oxidoreductase (luciferase family)
MGGASPASARRAARIADGYQPLADRLYEIYLEELDALKKARPTEAQRSNRGTAVYVHVADDPEREWALIERHVAHDAHEYLRWIGERQGTFTSTVDPASLRTSGKYRVLTPEECLAFARQEHQLVFKPLVGGLDPEIGWISLRLFAGSVLPQLVANQDTSNRPSSALTHPPLQSS